MSDNEYILDPQSLFGHSAKRYAQTTHVQLPDGSRLECGSTLAADAVASVINACVKKYIRSGE